MLAGLSLFQGGVLGLNTAAVVLLYKMHRDIGDVKRELSGVKRHHWAWIDRLRRFAWPDTFKHCDHALEGEPHHDAP